MKGKSLEQKDVQNENKMRGNVWKFLWTPKSGQMKNACRKTGVRIFLFREEEEEAL